MRDPYDQALERLDQLEQADTVSIIDAYRRTDRITAAGQQLADIIRAHKIRDIKTLNALKNWQSARNQ